MILTEPTTFSKMPKPEVNRPLVSVCMMTYRRDEVLLQSLARLRESTHPCLEILVVDNGRSTELPERLRRVPVPVRLLQPTSNLGCAGLNLALRQANGEYVVCFDDDSYPAPNGIEKAVLVFEANPDLGMLGFKLHDPATGQAWHDPWWNPDCTTPRPTVLCPGCGLAFRRDPRLPDELCLPDIVSQAHELSMAAEILRLDYRIEFRPDCVAYHPDTRLGYVGEKARGGNRNQLRFLLRYADALSLGIVLLSQACFAGRRQANDLRFAISYLVSAQRRPLPRRLMRQFREVLAWHTHPRLHRWL